jgi:hypothetical protein
MLPPKFRAFSGETYHENFTVMTTTPQAELLVTWSPARQSHPRPQDRTEMERLAPHPQISIALSGRRHSLILRYLDASKLYQVGLGVSL